MQQDSASFWTDIRDYEGQLAKNPDSFCFAKLSDIYRAVGLLDDALETARQGVAKHPAYLAGQRSLAMACYAKGLNNECQAALQQVTAALPEDAQAQKLLGRLYAEHGDLPAARQAYQTALEFVPDDVECRMELEALEQPDSSSVYQTGADLDDEILENLEIVEDDEPETGGDDTGAAVVAPAPDLQLPDPLSTVTLAELYVTQGFIHKALDIFRSILNADPENSLIRARIAALELQELVASEPSFIGTADTGSEETAAEIPEEELPDDVDDQPVFQASSAAVADWQKPGAGLMTARSDTTSTAVNPAATALPLKGSADNALSELELWLENIRRFKSCR